MASYQPNPSYRQRESSCVVPASPLAALEPPQRAVVGAVRTPRVVLADVVHPELAAAASDAVATGVQQAPCNGLERHVPGIEQRPLAARTLVTARPLQTGAAPAADVVSGLAQRDGRPHVLAAYGAGQRLQHAEVHRRSGHRLVHHPTPRLSTHAAKT